MNKNRLRRVVAIFCLFLFYLSTIIFNTPIINTNEQTTTKSQDNKGELALSALDKIPIKGRAPKTGYEREEFGQDWISQQGCDTRNIILNRDLEDVKTNEMCEVVSGVLNDPYTGKTINFMKGLESSYAVQIDHVVALSDAWQKGAQLLTLEQRINLANDPLELLAVDGQANQQKGDGDAATWLPSNKPFRCQYIARQIAVKYKYSLWVTQAEHDAMQNILKQCPDQALPN